MSQPSEDALSDPFEQTTYGKTAYQAYNGLLENDKDDFSWAMLTFALSLMGFDDEMRIVLARYALSGAPYNREVFAMGTFGFTKQPGVLKEWLRLVERKRGVDAEARQAIADFLKDQSRREAADAVRAVRADQAEGATAAEAAGSSDSADAAGTIRAEQTEGATAADAAGSSDSADAARTVRAEQTEGATAADAAGSSDSVDAARTVRAEQTEGATAADAAGSSDSADAAGNVSTVVGVVMAEGGNSAEEVARSSDHNAGDAEATGAVALSPASVGEWAECSFPLDMLRRTDLIEVVARLGKLSENPQTAAKAVHGLALLPDSNSGKWLRRVCRNAQIAPAVQTMALLAMRGIGMEGNVKVVKLGSEYTVDLGEPRLKNDLPPELMQVYDWVAIWLLRAEGSIGEAEFEAYADRGEPFPKELFDKTRAIFASPAMETVSRWLMAYYYYAFPALPVIAGEERQPWGEALLSLLQEAAARGEAAFVYEAPQLSDAGQERKTWLADAIRNSKPSA